jgi:pSer/pThr/pTyr-binding forkhead associated (FHA) protein
MGLELDVLSARHSVRVRIDDDKATVGKAPENTVALPEDAAASHMHAMFERFPAGWCVSDLGSSNGTWLNGERIWSQRRVRDGDEIRIGHTRLLVRDAEVNAGAPTDVEAAAPVLTTRERDVLISLCRPLLARDIFTEPSSSRSIADELVVTPAAVKQHLANLYDKFGISPSAPNRRVQLANEAVRRGSVSVADLASSSDTPR